MKVLSIDFDYIMAPCIKLYNSSVCGSENSTVVWNKLEQENGIDKFLSYDAFSLAKIFEVVIKNALKGAEFITIESHEQIVKCLPNDEKIDLVNVDFHHDIMYNNSSVQSILDQDEYNCADWVGYLHLKQRLNSYKWVKAAQSDMYFDDGNIGIKFEVAGRQSLPELKDDFDYVVLCLSPQWVPYKYHHLYELLVQTVKQIKAG